MGKRATNITLSDTARFAGDAIGLLDGCSISETIENLIRAEARRRGIEKAFTDAEIKAAVQAATTKRAAKGAKRKK